MKFLIEIFICGLVASAAFVLVQGLFDLRQRQVARFRAMGLRLNQGSLKEFLNELRRSRAERLEAKLPQAMRDALQAKIGKADSKISVGELFFDMLAFALAAACLGLLLDMGIYTFGAIVLGFALPLLRINDAGLRRQLSLRRDLPDALDLLCACVEAGLGFDQALARVAGRMKAGALRKELEACVASLSVGSPRREALRDLDKRAGLEELSQVVSALLQADKRGVALGPTLRAQSGQLRVLRSLRVKKAAAEAPLKMLFPLMAFILPVVFIVLFGPIILKWQSGGF